MYRQIFLAFLFLAASVQGQDDRKDNYEEGYELPAGEDHFYTVDRQDQAPNYDYYEEGPERTQEEQPHQGQGNVVEVLSQFGHGTMVNYLTKVNLAEELKAEGPFTVFVPTQTVFAQISDYLDALTEEELTSFLLNHVVPSYVRIEDIQDGQELETIHGGVLRMGVNPDTGVVHVEVEDGVANVLFPDMTATNGLIHEIDWALFLPDNEAAVTEAAAVDSS